MNFTLLQPHHYIKYARQLVQFVIRPLDQGIDQLSVLDRVKGTWTIFVIKMVLTVIISLVVGIIHDPVNKTTARHNEIFSPLILVFVGVLLLPLLEEIAFRLSLRFKPIFLSLSSAVFIYYLTTKGIYKTNLSDVSDHFYIRVSLAGFSIIAFYLIYSLPKIRATLETIWKDKFRWILYLLCLAFGMVHLFNYDLTLWNLLLLPLILLPKLLGALCYSFIRVNYGFIYSLGLHLCWNGIGVIMSLVPGD